MRRSLSYLIAKAAPTELVLHQGGMDHHAKRIE